MSCADNKTTATTNFNSESYSSSAFNIGLSEETSSTNNACEIVSVRGKVQLNLTNYTVGSCTVYFKVQAQTDGSSNSPPVTADNLYHAALSATMGQINTSDYYANSTPTFSASNDCMAASEILGWSLTAQVGVIQPTFTYFV